MSLISTEGNRAKAWSRISVVITLAGCRGVVWEGSTRSRPRAVVPTLRPLEAFAAVVKSVESPTPQTVQRESADTLDTPPVFGSDRARIPRPTRRHRNLDSLGQHLGSLGRQRLQVVQIGREDGPSRFRE